MTPEEADRLRAAVARLTTPQLHLLWRWLFLALLRALAGRGLALHPAARGGGGDMSDTWRLWVYPDDDDHRQLVLALTPEGRERSAEPAHRLADTPHVILHPLRALQLAAVLQAWGEARPREG